MTEEIRGPNAPWPIELDGIAASVTSETAEWSGTVEGRLRAEAARGRVRIQLVQWDRDDHEVSVNVTLTIEQARALATALREHDTETVRADRGSAWVHVGWIQQHDLGEDHDPDGTEVAVATVDRYTDWCEVSLRWEGEDGGQVSVETALEDEQVAAFRSWLGYAIAHAEAYEPELASESETDSEAGAASRSSSRIANALGTIGAAGVTVVGAFWVMNRVMSQADITVNGEPIGPLGLFMTGVFAVIVLALAFVIHAATSPNRRGGRGA